MKEYFEKVNLEKSQQTTKNREKNHPAFKALIMENQLFDTLIAFLKEFFEKVNFEKKKKKQQKTKYHEKIPSIQIFFPD